METPFLLYFLVDFITSTTGQIVIWGGLTITAFFYSFVSWLDSDSVDISKEWRFISAGVISVYWMFNIVLWFVVSLKLMIFMDILFVGLCIKLYVKTRFPWVKLLSFLYVLSFGLDLWMWQGLAQTPYAWLSNIVYAFQLLTVSGVSRRFRRWELPHPLLL